jgi:cation transport ATPase
VTAYFFGGHFTLKEAVEKIRAGKFEIDFLMIVAAAGAAALSAFAEGALLLFLFSIGHALEGYAMASASVGIAMGAAGSDVALEAADVALMADNLDHLPLAIGLSRATRRIIRQNLWMSLGMVAFLVPATILGLNIGPAVALHEGSTLVVVFNALRLLAYRSN